MRIAVKIVRVDRHSGATLSEMGELSVHHDARGIHVKMTKGGETGFEGFTISPGHQLHVHEWCACVGTRFEYDRVTVPKEEMERAYREAGVIE